MKSRQIVAAITLLGVCSAQPNPYALGGIPLSTSFRVFTAKYPGAICNGDPQFRSCRVDGLSIAGVIASRTDFNFVATMLTSINVVFDPTPTDEQLNAMEHEFSKLYGPPARREVSPSHQLHAAWQDGTRRLLFNVGLDRTIIILETVQ